MSKFIFEGDIEFSKYNIQMLHVPNDDGTYDTIIKFTEKKIINCFKCNKTKGECNFFNNNDKTGVFICNKCF